MKTLVLLHQRDGSVLETFELTEKGFKNQPVEVVRYRDGQEAAYALEKSDCEFVAFVEPGTTPKSDDGVQRMMQKLQEGDFAMAYCDYLENGKTIETFDPVYEIHERFDYGRFRLYSRKWVEKAGGINPNFRFAVEYDLRIRIQEEHSGRFVRIPDPLFDSIPKSQTIRSDKLHSKSFGYLFYPPDEEREYEKAFKDMLLRIDAFLHGGYEKVFDPLKHEVKVTVVIPVLNRAKYIGYAIQSVLNQTLQDFEVIVVDNGSTDGTQDVVRSFTDRRVKLIQNPGGTIAFALNTGIRAARGKYIAQLDSDDVYVPETLAEMTAALDANPYAGLAISYYELMDADGNVMPEFGVITHLEYDRNNILRVDGAGAVRVWRRAVLMRFGLFDERDFGNYGEDYDMVLKVSEHHEVIRVHKPLYRYRRHEGSTEITRPAWYRIYTKARARRIALYRRKLINQVKKLAKGLKGGS